MSACLQVDRIAGSRIHVVSWYAPTRAASKEDKEAFENIISSVPSEERYVLLGDFNTRVGSRDSDDKQYESPTRVWSSQ